MSRTQFCPKVRQPHLHRASMSTAAQLSCHCSNWRTHSSCLDGYRSPFSGLFFLSRSSSPICSPCTLCCLNASTLDELFSLGPSINPHPNPKFFLQLSISLSFGAFSLGALIIASSIYFIIVFVFVGLCLGQGGSVCPIPSTSTVSGTLPDLC